MNVVKHCQAVFSLAELLAEYTEITINLAISGLALNSADIRPGDVFFALPGNQYHGLTFANKAIDKGAVAVVYDPAGTDSKVLKQIASTVTIAIPDLSTKLGIIGARFYGYPTAQLHVIGITGTNGKTSCSQFLGQALDNCGIVGTLGSGIWGQLKATVNTTPEALALQKILATMVAQKQNYVAMEVSSHGIVQGRVNGIVFKGAVITNISRDHLDYHGSMAAYVGAKIRLLKTPELQYAVIDLDNDFYQQIIAEIPEQVNVWMVSRSAIKMQSTQAKTLFAEHIVTNEHGLQFTVVFGQQRLLAKAAVYGEFNVSNLLVVLAILLANGCPFALAVARLDRIQPIPGRMENIHFSKNSPAVFIDYAHTPDALKQVLLSAKTYCQHKLWLVFGCGGDRDTGKRALMGSVAQRYADRIIITDDNPRNEDPSAIVDDILTGCNRSKKPSLVVIHNRQRAIATALQQADSDDCVVITGKGHETYQEIAGQKHFFSDRKLLKEMLLTHREHS